MANAPLPENEDKRLHVLKSLKILDTPHEERFDRLTRLAAKLIGCPLSLVSLVDAKRQWFKSHYGTEATQTDRSISFCAHAILRDEPFIITDATKDTRVADNSNVTGDPNIRAYMGIPLHAEEGIRLGTFCVIDMVPRKFTREEIEILQELAAIAEDEVANIRLNELVVELKLARERAEQADRSKSEFLAMMSHEIRTPLNGILGFTELLKESRLETVQREQLEMVWSSGRHLMGLINDVLDFSKIEAGRLDIVEEPFCPAELVEDMVQLFGGQAKAKALTLACNVDPKVPVALSSDPHRLRQILSNLIGNALKFTASGGVDVALRLSSEDKDHCLLEFEVRDTGMGIPREKADKLFQPFVQGDASIARKHGGTGLGLTICRRLCQMLGGDIRLESESGKGSSFIFTIRAAKVTDGEAEAVKEAAHSEGDPDPSLKVLVAEDNNVNRKLIQSFCSRLGIKPQIVENGAEVVQLWEKGERYDLILMDVNMPVMDGLEATRRIRELEKSAGVNNPSKIIAFTADAMEKDRLACGDAGMDGYLGKPVRLEELRRVMAAVSRISHE